MNFKNILIATDLSEESQATLRFIAKNILSAEKITVVSVVQNVVLADYPYLSDPNFEKSLVEMASTRLDEIITECLPRSTVKKHVSLAFNIPEEICRTAREEKCDLILLGSHGAGALANLFIGNTVQRVIKLAPCPILVIPKGISQE